MKETPESKLKTQFSFLISCREDPDLTAIIRDWKPPQLRDLTDLIQTYSNK